MAYPIRNLSIEPKNTYRDNMGHVYGMSTETGEVPTSMEHLRYALVDGGDCTQCEETVGAAPTSMPAGYAAH